MIIRTLETKSTSATNPVTARYILETIHIQTESKPTSIFVCVCTDSYVVLMTDYMLSVNGDITYDMTT